MSDDRNAAFYRQRAAHMRAQAEAARSDQLRQSYLIIAADWERLADQAERGEGRPTAQPPRKDSAKDGEPAET